MGRTEQNNSPASPIDLEWIEGWFPSVFIEELWDFEWATWSGLEWFDKICSSTDSLLGEISLLLEAGRSSATESECLVSTALECGLGEDDFASAELSKSLLYWVFLLLLDLPYAFINPKWFF